MTVNVIGKPPAPKRGATFADVPRGDLFGHRSGSTYRKRDASSAISTVSGITVSFEPGVPVTLLTQPTPVEPEPDPAVVACGELPPGSLFTHHLDADPGNDIWMRGDERDMHTRDGRLSETGEETPVRRVPASLVVHEEPGKWVSEDGHFLHHGSAFKLTVETATAMARQLVGWLAREAAKPKPPSADERRAAQIARLPTQRLPEPAEDRTKPAPGWSSPYYRLGGWCTSGPHKAHNGFSSPADAIAWTWAEHDAAQAREDGGE